MNARLEELAKQADSYAWYDHRYPEDLSENYHMIFEAKFAELIVKECAGIAYEYDAPKMSGPGMVIAATIETHFGVEE